MFQKEKEKKRERRRRKKEEKGNATVSNKLNPGGYYFDKDPYFIESEPVL